MYTAVSSEAWAKLRDWASVAAKGRLLLSGSVAHASLKTAVHNSLRYLRISQTARQTQSSKICPCLILLDNLEQKVIIHVG